MKFNPFNEVEPKRLRVFNRVVMSHNIFEDFGKHSLDSYLKQFSVEDRLEMGVLSSYIKKVGPDRVRKEVTKGIIFND